jgi:hypothetical protein
MHGPRFGIVAFKAPIALPRFSMNAVLPKVALMDAGVAWLVGLLEQAKPRPVRRPGRKRG